MDKKLLSVIVPSYNMEAYLRKNCDSLLIGGEEQEWLDVILVNDGSTDKTSAIAHEYVTRFPTVFRVIDKVNGHYGSCVNAGLAIAKGVYTKVLDADDYVDTEAFRLYVKTLAAENVVGVVDLIISDYTKVDNDGRVLDVVRYPLPRGHITMLDVGWMSFYPHAIAYRTALLHDMHYQQTEGCAYTDGDWCNHPLAFVKTAFYYNESVTNYLLGRDGQSVDPKVMLRDISVLLGLVLGNMAFYKAVKNQLESKYLEIFRQRIAWRIVGAYSMVLLGINGRIPSFDLRPFDDAVRAFGEGVEAFTDGQWIPYSLFGRRRKLRYIRLWRKHQTRKTFTFWLYDHFGRPLKA